LGIGSDQERIRKIARNLPSSIPRNEIVGGVIGVSATTIYRPVRKLGEGAAGVVYESQATKIQDSKVASTMCAIKVLKPLSRIAPTESAYERIEKRFIAEAKSATQDTQEAQLTLRSEAHNEYAGKTLLLSY
jgi:hypothetical protein